MAAWISSWMLAWAIATPIVFITAPFSKYVAKKLSDDPRAVSYTHLKLTTILIV